jgi:hypothetical protein
MVVLAGSLRKSMWPSTIKGRRSSPLTAGQTTLSQDNDERRAFSKRKSAIRNCDAAGGLWLLGGRLVE